MPCLLMLMLAAEFGDDARCCSILYSRFGKIQNLCSWAASRHYVPGQAVGHADEMVVDHRLPPYTCAMFGLRFAEQNGLIPTPGPGSRRTRSRNGPASSSSCTTSFGLRAVHVRIRATITNTSGCPMGEPSDTVLAGVTC